MIFIGARFCRNLDLRIAAPHFRIYGGQQHFKFPNQVRIDAGGGIDTGQKTHTIHSDSVPLYIYSGSGDTGETCVGGPKNRVVRHDHAGHDFDQIHRVSVDQRKLLHSLCGKHITDRRT